MIVVCLATLGIVTNAETKTFNVTSSNTNYATSPDPWTPRAIKSSVNYETSFYVRTYTMSGSCSYIKFYAKNLDTGHYYNTPLKYYRSNLNTLWAQYYDASAPSGDYYALCMVPEYGYAGINATGKFTP